MRKLILLVFFILVLPLEVDAWELYYESNQEAEDLCKYMTHKRCEEECTGTKVDGKLYIFINDSNGWDIKAYQKDNYTCWGFKNVTYLDFNLLPLFDSYGNINHRPEVGEEIDVTNQDYLYYSVSNNPRVSYIYKNNKSPIKVYYNTLKPIDASWLIAYQDYTYHKSYGSIHLLGKGVVNSFKTYREK